MEQLGVYLRNKKIWLALGCFVIIFLSFIGNLFGSGSSQSWFNGFQNDSARIVKEAAACKDVDGVYDGPVHPQSKREGRVDNVWCPLQKHSPYVSQFGMQARVIAYFAPNNDKQLPGYFHKVEIVLAALTALLFVVFVFRVAKLFNPRVATTVFLLICVSPWVVAYARNMYWVAFLMFLPFVFGFCCYPYFKERKKLWAYYVILAGLFLLKLLDGYEHISTVVVSGLVPVIFYELIQNKNRKLTTFWRPAAAVLAGGVGALLIAMVMNVSSLATYYGSWAQGFEAVTARADTRSVNFMSYQKYVISDFKRTLPDTYAFVDKIYDLDVLADGNGNPLKYAALSLLNYALLPAVSLPFVFREPIGTVLQSIIMVVLVAYLCLRKINRKKVIDGSKIKTLRYGFWLSLAGGLSWLILMPGHAYPHSHLNGIIFYLPLLLFCYVIIGIYIDYIVKKYAKR